MKLDFLELRDYINSLANNNSINNDFDESELANHIFKEVRGVRSKLINESRVLDRKTTRHYIRCLHEALLDLSTAFVHVPRIQSSLKKAIICFNEFLYSSYHMELDLTWRPTQAFITNSVSRCANVVNEVHKAVVKGKVDKELKEIVLNFIRQDCCKIISYAQLEYYKLFVYQMHKRFRKKPINQADLEKALVYLNFNSSHFIRYFLRQFRQAFDESWNFKDAQLHVKKALTKVRGSLERQSPPYNPSAPSLCYLAVKLLVSNRSYNLKRYAAEQQPLLDQKAEEDAKMRMKKKEEIKLKKRLIRRNMASNDD